MCRFGRTALASLQIDTPGHLCSHSTLSTLLKILNSSHSMILLRFYCMYYKKGNLV